MRHWKAIEAWSAEEPAQPASDLEEPLHPEGEHRRGSAEVQSLAAPMLHLLRAHRIADMHHKMWGHETIQRKLLGGYLLAWDRAVWSDASLGHEWRVGLIWQGKWTDDIASDGCRKRA